MKKIFFSLCLFMYSSALLGDTLKVVYHLNEREKAIVLVSSIQELLKLNPETQIEVVIHGSAIIRLAKDDGLNDKFEDLLSKGVVIGACSISMLKNDLRPDILADGVVQLKQGGVLRILELQKQGYYYIKI